MKTKSRKSMKTDPRKQKFGSSTNPIAQVLKEERLKLGLTQKEFADRLDVNLKALRNLEQGKEDVKISTANEILNLLGKELRPGRLVSKPKKKKKKVLKKATILKTLEAVFPILELKFGIIKIGLFGSYSRGEGTAKSDIDLEIQSKEKLNLSEIGAITVLLETMLDGRKVDLVEEREMNKEVKKSAKKDIIYVKKDRL